MTTLYSKLLYVTTDIPTTGTNLATVPSGFVWVLRDIHIYNRNNPWWQALVGVKLGFAFNNLFYRATYPTARGATVHSWSGRIVMPGATFLYGVAGESGWNLEVSGYELSSP